MKKYILIVLVVVLVVLGLQFYRSKMVSIEDYVSKNISTISTEKEVLGGKFYVTKIEAEGGKGTVSYEDGHNAFVADFTYRQDHLGSYTITSFVVRK